MAASLAIFAALFFTVIKPSSDTANQAVKSGLQQSQQVLNQAQKQITSAGGAGSSVPKQAKQQLSKASKLTGCVAAAGTESPHAHPRSGVPSPCRRPRSGNGRAELRWPTDVHPLRVGVVLPRGRPPAIRPRPRPLDPGGWAPGAPRGPVAALQPGVR